MNAPTTIIDHPHFTDTTATSARGHYTILTACRQADFLKSLQLFGNVRLACRTACVSAQTAYRARRNSHGFALAWDAALLAARAHAEATLADRAINGVEEAVYYHGEEIGRRKRYSDRLLLAHLARLDRLEERAEVAHALTQLDAVVDALSEGADVDEVFGCAGEGDGGPENDPQDRVPCVPSCRTPRSRSEAVAQTNAIPALEARLSAMDDARPLGAATPYALSKAHPPRDPDTISPVTWVDRIEAEQLRAFEAGEERWWESLPEQAQAGETLRACSTPGDS